MSLHLRTCLLAAALLAACGDDAPASDTGENNDPENNDAGRLDGGRPALDGTTPPSSDASDARDARVDAAAADKFAMCVGALKPICSYDEKEIACASVKTPKIPLTDGGVWGDLQVKGGPYGAIVDWNQGKDFATGPSWLEGTCDVLAWSFGEPESVTNDILNLRGADLGLYTVFRPACMKDGETYPVITWGNGTCGQTGGYATQLATLASYGFVVIAPNSRFTDQGNNEMLRALDFAAAANADAKSPLYQHLDLSKVGAMGHSQGAAATMDAATDSRVKALILWNGVSGSPPNKPFLTVSGDRDINDPTVSTLSTFVDQATQPGAWLFYHQVLETGGLVTGHLTLMEQPERVSDVTVNWWKYILQNDAQAKKMFVGTDCTLCAEKTAHEYGQKGLK